MEKGASSSIVKKIHTSFGDQPKVEVLSGLKL